MSLHPLENAEQAVAFLRSHVSGTLHSDSRRMTPGDGFIAWPGAATDGRLHLADALERGAAACVVEAHEVQALAQRGGWAQQCVPIATLPQLKAATGHIAAQWFDRPSDPRTLQVLAVTGTNGKTSTAYWLAQAIDLLCTQGRIPRSGCAVVGTLGLGVLPHLQSTGMTTPDPVQLQRAFRTFADQRLGYCAIEASSIGLAEQRLAATQVSVAIFTNFTQDHLDYHGSMQAYWHAKAQLFDAAGLKAAVVNLDDPHGAQLHARLMQRSPLDVWGYALRGPARLQARDIGFGAQGLCFTVVEGAQCAPLQTSLIGHYNVANLLGVIATLRSVGVAFGDAVAVCAHLTPVPGRMEQMTFDGQPLVAVDYAHTPDALQQALAALHPLAQARGGRVWCVFGCGGNRDSGKRPLMGAAAQQGAQRVIVTNDNPRDEVPESIIEDILGGMHCSAAPLQGQVQVQPDRAQAIAQAITEADAADVVLIAGKGHEDYQEIQGQRQAFCDKAQARAALALRPQRQARSP